MTIVSTGFAGTLEPRAGDLPGLLRSCGIRPKKSLSQNFLISEGVMDRIVDLVAAAGPRTLEIGAGPGLITRRLGKRVSRVLAFELDERFRLLHAQLGFPPAVEMRYADFLTADLGQITGSGEAWSVIGNIPYAITGLILRRLLDSRLNVNSIHLLVQEEVARRLTAGPGRESGMVTAFAWLFGEAEIAFRVKAGSFLPPPRVGSAFVVLRRRERGLDLDERAPLSAFIHAAFAARRKTLANSLALGYKGSGGTELWRTRLRQAGVDPQIRAETLGAEELLRIFRQLRAQDSHELC